MSWRWIFGIVVGAVSVFSMTAIPIVITCSTSEIQKTANKWSRGNYSDVVVPHIVVSDAVLTDKQKKIVRESVEEINKQMNRTLFVYSTTKPNNKQYTNVTNSKHNPTLCNVFSSTYGQNERFPTFEKPTHHFVATICFDKITKHTQMVGYQGSREKQELVNILKRGREKMIVMHELMHSLLGYPKNTNQHHPTVGCELMCSFPKSTKIGTVTKLIIKQHVK